MARGAGSCRPGVGAFVVVSNGPELALSVPVLHGEKKEKRSREAKGLGRPSSFSWASCSRAVGRCCWFCPMPQHLKLVEARTFSLYRVASAQQSKRWLTKCHLRCPVHIWDQQVGPRQAGLRAGVGEHLPWEGLARELAPKSELPAARVA